MKFYGGLKQIRQIKKKVKLHFFEMLSYVWGCDCQFFKMLFRAYGSGYILISVVNLC